MSTGATSRHREHLLALFSYGGEQRGLWRASFIGAHRSLHSPPSAEVWPLMSLQSNKRNQQGPPLPPILQASQAPVHCPLSPGHQWTCLLLTCPLLPPAVLSLILCKFFVLRCWPGSALSPSLLVPHPLWTGLVSVTISTPSSVPTGHFLRCMARLRQLTYPTPNPSVPLLLS